MKMFQVASRKITVGVMAAAIATLGLAAAGPASAETTATTAASSTRVVPVTGDAYTWSLLAVISAMNKCVNTGGTVDLNSRTIPTDVGNGLLTETVMCIYNN
ncbi:hypothetical protein [Streptomyces griseorubiginosus]|uniref:hypothetical protein n=1 Tax=Streptomyces griseorubiginosus TaxID=67304 RepID=UPI001AD76331|nr:hypothetical protein [Streptomyces griseorubiginosus]MBO4255638.1 hypothetical protein [Streptomyces griseorubiginosus]